MTWPAPNPDEWVYLLKPAALVENVECQTCGGRRKVQGMYHRPGDLLFDCPTCRTPKNVECTKCDGNGINAGSPWVDCQTCNGTGNDMPICDYCGSGGIHPEYVIENCPKCSTPENVEEPT